MVRANHRFARWEGVTREQIRLAEDRTAFLRESHLLASNPLRLTHANAYLQGVADAADVAARMLDRAVEPTFKRDAPGGLA
jgi:hypothetical protein